MALFGRRRNPEPVTHAATPVAAYDDEWFALYWDDIFHTSGVVDDEQNRMQLVMMTLKVLDDQANDWFSQLSDERVSLEYALIVDQSASIGQRAKFVLAWNPAVAPLMPGKFDRFRDIFIAAGREHERFRFFPSDCCGEPVEFDLQTGAGGCSECGRLQRVA